MMTQPPEKENQRRKSPRNQLWIPLQVGCFTLFVAGFALIGGLLLDFRLETFPRWTLILVLGSAPITLFTVFWIVRRSLKKMRGQEDSDE